MTVSSNSSPTSHPSNESDRQIVITRIIAASLAAVHEAWTDPRQLERWWGPRGFTTTTHRGDIRPGGVWRYTMHGPDGTDYENEIRYQTINLERIEYEHGEPDPNAPAFHVVATFREDQGKTEIRMTMTFSSKEARDAAAPYGAAEGGEETLARLEELLASPMRSGA